MIDKKQLELGGLLFNELQRQYPEIRLADVTGSATHPEHVRLSIVMPSDEVRRIKLRETAARIAADILRDHGYRISISAAATWDGEAT